MADKPTFDLPHLNRLLAALPAYTEVVLTFDHARSQRLLARDLPGPDRRFTNLDSGTEWFLPLNDTLAPTGCEIPAVSLKVWS